MDARGIIYGNTTQSVRREHGKSKEIRQKVHSACQVDIELTVQQMMLQVCRYLRR